jgi:hypothetical protein
VINPVRLVPLLEQKGVLVVLLATSLESIIPAELVIQVAKLVLPVIANLVPRVILYNTVWSKKEYVPAKMAYSIIRVSVPLATPYVKLVKMQLSRVA